MVIGNPYCFAIVWDVVKKWNIDHTFQNGILFFLVNAELFPKDIISATLESEIPRLKKSLENIVVNEKLYDMHKTEAFNEMYNITFPCCDNGENDYRYIISTPSLLDNDYFVFAVSNGKSVRILVSQLNYMPEEAKREWSDIAISETFISVQELGEIASLLKLS